MVNYAELVPTLAKAGFSETEIAIKLNLPFYEVRKHKRRARCQLEAMLPLQAAEELRLTRGELRLTDLAKKYYCTMYEVRRALYYKDTKARKPRHSHEDIKEYLKTHTQAEAVEHFGCHHMLVRFLARKAGLIPGARPRIKLTKATVDRIESMASHGATQQTISEALGLSQASVSRCLKKASKGPYNRDLNWAEVEKALATMTVSEVSRKFKVSRAAIYNHNRRKNNGDQVQSKTTL